MPADYTMLAIPSLYTFLCFLLCVFLMLLCSRERARHAGKHSAIHIQKPAAKPSVFSWSFRSSVAWWYLCRGNTNGLE